MLESNQAMSLLTIMEIVGPLLLLAILIYGTLQWSRRRRGPTQAVREDQRASSIARAPERKSVKKQSRHGGEPRLIHSGRGGCLLGGAFEFGPCFLSGSLEFRPCFPERTFRRLFGLR